MQSDSSPPPISAAVLRQAQDGDEGACRELLRAHQRAVYGLIWRMLAGQSTTEAAADLTQETFIKVFGALSRFELDGPASLSTWILTIATRLTLNHLRAHRRAPKRHRADQRQRERRLAV